MTWPSFTLLFVGLTVAATVCRLFYNRFLHPLADIPGPYLASITGLWRTKRYMQSQWHQDILDLHQKYGRVVRIAPNELSLVDEQAAKKLYGHGHNISKTNWYDTWSPSFSGPPGLFQTTDKHTHAFLRKRVAAPYSMTGILKYEADIQECLDLLFERLTTHANAGELIDMSDWTNAFAFDVVGALAYGEPLGNLRTETDVMSLRHTIFTAFTVMATLGHLPLQSRLLSNHIVGFVAGLFGVPNPFKEFEKWSTNKVNARLAEVDKGTALREDMLAHFCRMRAADGGPAAANEILLECMNIIGAGADTVSIGMRSCLYFVCATPEVYRKLQREVDEFYDTHGSGQPITYRQTQQLPYLTAVVREATRLFPSIPFQLLRHAPPDFDVDGRRIPEGTPVGISAIAQNRDPAVWGEDAEEFRPERWLQSDEQTRYLESCNLTFGGNGPRMCIGKNLALVEMHKFLAQFVRLFDFEVADTSNPWRVTTFWFAYQHDFKMRLRRRAAS